MALALHLPRLACVAGAFWAASAAGAEPVRYQSVVFPRVDVKRDVEFRTATNAAGVAEKLHLDVYQPTGDTERTRPAILWFHGGGLRPGVDKRQNYLVTIATEFAKRGYVSISPDYRVTNDRTLAQPRRQADAVEDCRAAVAWTKAHAVELGIDPRRIAIGGGSSGGNIAVVLVAAENNAAAKAGSPPLFALVELWGTPGEAITRAAVNQHFPPTVIVHGTADQSVPFARSEVLVECLKTLGIKHTFLPLPGAPHTPMTHADAIIETSTAFVFEALKK